MMHTYPKKTLRLIILFVNLAIPLGGMSTDIFLPSLPAMTAFFMSSDTMIQLSITFFALGLSIGQFIIGPISDNLGRRKPVFLGILLQITTTLTIIFTRSIITVDFARFLQGLGAAVMMVPSRAMLADCFHGAQLKRHFTYITASFSIGPIIAPFIGGYLQHTFGWHSNFIFIVIFLSLLLLMIFALPETMEHRKALSMKKIKNSYSYFLNNTFFMSSVLLAGVFLAFTSIFNVTGPFLIQETLHRSAIFYGYMALLSGACWFFGNLTNRYTQQIHWKTKLHIVMPLMILNGIIFVYISSTTISIAKFIVPVLIMIYLAGILFPMMVAETLSQFKKDAGSANGILFSLVWIVFSLFTFIGSQIHPNNALPIAYLYLCIAIISYLFFILRFINCDIDSTP